MRVSISTILASCVFLVGCSTVKPPLPTTLEKRATLAVSLFNEAYADDSGPGAAFLISHDGEVLASNAIGYADLEWEAQLTDETLLRLGSISKPITSIAVLQLVEKGMLDIDTPISGYAPNLPAQIGAVTLRQLMSHRSGLAEHVFNPALLPFIWQPMTTDQIIDLQKEEPVNFKPDEQYEYVNFNYVVVAHIIEKVTGRSYVDFINEDVFSALGMTNSRYDQNNIIIPGRAEFYDEQEGFLANTAAVDLSHVSAAGALLSSVKDMNHWAHLLNSGGLVSATTLKEALIPAPLPDGAPTTYGLGFNIGDPNSDKMIWHNGLTPGAQGAMALEPEAGIFIIVLSNGFHLPNTTKVMRRMMAAMLTDDIQE